MDDSKQQLDAVQRESVLGNLSSDSWRECHRKFDETLKTIQKIKKDLANAEADAEFLNQTILLYKGDDPD